MRLIPCLLILLFCQSELSAQYHYKPADTATLEYFFADSTHIGRKGHNKITLEKYSTADSSYVIIKFYARSAGRKWVLKQKIPFSKRYVFNLDPKMSDFNHDGLEDFTYISMLAGRGANEVRRLFIYDKNKDRLVYMRNSEAYPNMVYNKQLNCIDAWLVYGGCSTVFLRIRENRLVEFASIDVTRDEGLNVYTTNAKGRRKLIRHDAKIDGFEFVRFKNYQPLEYADQ
jgi:hypothetical protein